MIIEGCQGSLDKTRESFPSEDVLRQSQTVPFPANSILFNAHHSPCGAFASFTIGSRGSRGGLGLELASPANEPVYVGVEDAEEPSHYRALPFFDLQFIDRATEFDVEGLSGFHRTSRIAHFEESQIERDFGPSVDSWKAGDLTFRIISPVRAMPDPEIASDAEMREAVAPAIVAELTIDNSRGTRARKAFFGYAGSARSCGMRLLTGSGLTGIAQGLSTAAATSDEGVYAGLAWQAEAILDPSHPANLNFMLGSLGLLVGKVSPGEVRTFRFAIAFFREGTATTGISTRYLYRRYFESVEEVAKFALTSEAYSYAKCKSYDDNLLRGMSHARALMLSHAIRSYFGATQLLETQAGKPLWVVNEGEYRMMNTFDLMVDQAFFELALNPWTVRNELDTFVDRYSYEDDLRFPGDPQLHPGGLTFTHDMGVANSFSGEGHSSYELAKLDGCFSYMSCEELVNWILCASMYVALVRDQAWLGRRGPIFVATLQSLMNRDHPDPAMRNGVMGLDSSRCDGGAEITTYDSLDTSLGQARNNVYLAVKGWAAYVLVEPILRELGETALAAEASEQAARCAATVAYSVESDGCLPAIIGERSKARVIPAIEGLIYPFATGQMEALDPAGKYANLIASLRNHFEKVLETGQCRFADGGWRLSSSSRNSWLSKIYLCQAVAEDVFGLEPDRQADSAHLGWLLDPQNSYYAWSDQMLEGKAVGSRYYPRGVTAAMWLSEGCGDPIGRLRKRLNPADVS